MVEAILLVPGVPALLFVMLLALGRFEAAVTPEAEPRESPEREPVATLE